MTRADTPMTEPPDPPSYYATYRDFLDKDPRRLDSALEFGHNWRDQDGRRYRVCWYEQTGELTAEQLSDTEPLDVEDFYRGVSGPIEIIASVATRGEIEQLIGRWPHAALGRPRTLVRLRQLAVP